MERCEVMEVQVRRGDTLWKYSELFQIPIVLIEQSNPGIVANTLNIGQKIRIPSYDTRSYTIKQGDTLWNIANQNQIPLEALLLANPNVQPNFLQINATINIPFRVTKRIITDPSRYTYDKMVNDIQRLQRIYPFITSRSIGKSVMNKDLIELRIGTGTKLVNMNGSFHANEWITTPVLMRFLNDYALSLSNNVPIRGMFLLPLFQQTTLSIVPMVNPDGVNLVIDGVSSAGNFSESVLAINKQNEDFSNWKANIRGVDLNNQFPALWEIEAERKPNTPQPRDYPGPYPLSEPESQAMAALANNEQFARMNAYHTQGEVIFWGFEGLEPPISEAIVNEYARVSGYEPIRYVDSYAGYKDWFIQDFRRPGFTIELGHGTNPLPIEQFPEIYERSLGIMLANLYA